MPQDEDPRGYVHVAVAFDARDVVHERDAFIRKRKGERRGDADPTTSSVRDLRVAEDAADHFWKVSKVVELSRYGSTFQC